MLAYAIAVFQRGSLGVASLQAEHRLHVGAQGLSLFVVLQLAVYAGMQVPVGVALDRFGTRKLVVTGGIVMAAGQVTLAVSHSLGPAVAGRVLVGAGDAMTFISVLRLVAHWFPPRQAPLITQLTALLGQFGQVAAAYPLVALLRGVGWQDAFLGAAAVGGVIAAASLAGLRDAPPGHHVSGVSTSPAVVVERIRVSWQQPATRLGFWTHFTTQFSGNAFALLWGYPFLVDAELLSPATAGALLTVQVAVSMAVGPVVGRLTAGWPKRRSAMSFTVVAITAASWAVLLLFTHRAPLGLLVLLVVVLGTNGPGSMVGIDYARTHNPVERIGSASGLVNMGGFVATLVTLILIGLVLGGAAARGAHYTVAEFRAAFAVQWLLWVAGAVMMWRARRRLRERDREVGVALVDPLPQAIARRVRERDRDRNRDRDRAGEGGGERGVNRSGGHRVE